MDKHRLHIMMENLQVLDLDPGSGIGEIREAYRLLTREWNPEPFSHDPKLSAAAERRRHEIKHAYEWLTANADMVTAQARPVVGSSKSKKSSSSRYSTQAILYFAVIGILVLGIGYIAITNSDAWVGPLMRLPIGAQ